MAAMPSRRAGAASSAWWALAALALAADCGDGVQPKGTSGGSAGTTLVAGGALPFSASQATVLLGEGACAAAGVGHAAYAKLVASERSDTCAAWQAGSALASNRTIEVLLVDPLAAAGLVAVGAYPVSATPGAAGAHALVAVRQAGGACEVSALPASAGTVQVTGSTAGRLAGTVVAYLASGGEVIGAFDAAPCAVAASVDLCTGEVAPATSNCAP